MTGPGTTGSPQADEPAQTSASIPPEATAAPPPPPPPSASPATSTAPAAFGASTLAAGPLEGTTVADFVTRLIAFIIDGFILAVANYVIWAILSFLPFGIDVLVDAIAVAAVSAGYFVYFWTNRRQTPGMTVMKLMVVQDGTGEALTQDQAIRRWLYLGLPYALSTLVSVVGVGSFGFGLGGLVILATLASIAALLSILWQLYLAYTTYQDPRKQGIHDKAVNSVVVSYGASPLGGPR